MFPPALGGADDGHRVAYRVLHHDDVVLKQNRNELRRWRMILQVKGHVIWR